MKLLPEKGGGNGGGTSNFHMETTKNTSCKVQHGVQVKILEAHTGMVLA